MRAANLHTRLDRAFAQPSATPRCRRSAVSTRAAIAAPAKTKVNTQKSEEVMRLPDSLQARKLFQ